MIQKKCKHCATLIPKEAKVCPQCRKRQGVRLIWKVLIVLLFLGVVGGVIDNLVKSAGEREELTAAGQLVKGKHHDWPNNICNYVSKKQIVEGMTRDQVRAAWGKPDLINKEAVPGASQEVWLYGTLLNGTRCAFAGDKLVTFIAKSLR